MPGSYLFRNVRHQATFAMLAFASYMASISDAPTKETSTLGNIPAKACRTLAIRYNGTPTSITGQITTILTKRIQERSPVKFVEEEQAADCVIELRLEAEIGAEGFRISDRPEGGLIIAGNDPRGLLFGTGKLLRASQYGSEGFVPGAWRGVSTPDKPLRGIYFATHFHNWHHVAPLDEVTRYVEDLALWGTNSYAVWFDFHHYNGIDDPEAHAMLERLRAVFRRVKELGLSTSLAGLSNEGYANSPVEMRGEFSVQNGYFEKPPVYQVELCPNKPGAIELETKWHLERIRAFADIGVDSVWLWPYDQGGCTCVQCAPWGANGYLTMTEPVARAIRKFDPNIKTLISTWYFDRLVPGEWEGISKRFSEGRPDWADYIFVDQYGGGFPQYPLKHGSPGGIPMINFPEISMYQHRPWGGYGANPTPTYLQDLWNQAGDKLSGGFPYSEGIYEDINKAICAQLYWNSDRPTSDTVNEYIAYHFSPAMIEPVSRAIGILERNLERRREDRDNATLIVMQRTDGAREAFELLESVDGQLPPAIKSSWRWRVLYLRALIDAELTKNQFRVSKRCMKAFDELNKIYHDSELSLYEVHPPDNILGVVADSE